MSRGYELYEKLKDMVDPVDILEELARQMPDDELLDAMKSVMTAFDIEV